MSVQKPLCRLCERPVADGSLSSAQVAQDELKTWFANVCERTLPEGSTHADKICYFCVWQAQFLVEIEPKLMAMAWWPLKIDYGPYGKILRKHFLAGTADQCWVQLEMVEQPKNSKNNAENSAEYTIKWCEPSVMCKLEVVDLLPVIKKEKDEDLGALSDLKVLKCVLCETNEFFGCTESLRNHVKLVHSDYFLCTSQTCVSSFVSESEMRSHVDSLHEHECGSILFQCGSCGFRAESGKELFSHVASTHQKQTAGVHCDACSRQSAAGKRAKCTHRSQLCRFCMSEVAFRSSWRHTRQRNCSRCGESFDCGGLLQAHLKVCSSNRKRSVKTRSDVNGFGHKCDACLANFESDELLKEHACQVHAGTDFVPVKRRKLIKTRV